MSAHTPPEIYYARSGQRLHLAFTGSATHLATLAADNLVAEFLQPTPDQPEVVVDLAHASHVDSTFAGWLIRLRHRLDDRHGHLAIARCPAACHSQLDVMGLVKLFDFVETPPPAQMAHIKCTDPDGAGVDEQVELMLDAHEELSQVNDKNEQVFTPIADALRRELERRRDQHPDNES